jgi:MFS family permease
MHISKKTHAPSPSETSAPGFYYGYVIVASGFMVLMLVYGAQFSFGVFFKPMLKEFGLSRGVLSGAYSLNLAMQAVAYIFTGKLSDRYGPRLVVTCCGVCLGSSYLLMSQVQMVWQIYIIFGVLTSIGTACALVPLLSTIARWFVSTRGLMSGIAAAGVGVGTLLLPPLCSYSIASFGWRTSYIIVGLAVLILLVLSAQLLKRDPSQIMQSVRGRSMQHANRVGDYTFRDALSTKQFWLLSGVFFLLGACVHSVFVHIVPHATDVGIPEVTAATIISVIGGVSIISKIGIGLAIDRFGNKPVTLIISSLMLISLITLQLPDTLGGFHVFAAIFAFSYGGFVAIQSPYVAELFGLKYHGAIFGFALFIQGAGAFGPFASGKIFDATSSYRLAFVMLAILSFLAIFLTLGIKNTDRQNIH